ncbi:MAG: recombination protein RecR [Armatimonadia bacterium]|nr:recombination protein RecR [Armatimonadia bacterium]
MLNYAEPIRELIEELESLPGIGPKSAQRLAFYILSAGPERAHALADAVVGVHDRIRRCERCGNWSVHQLCPVCTDDRRETDVICAVADAKDLMALERAGEFSGLYHVLDGVLSPVEGVGPGDLRINELLQRVDELGVREVILATPPTVEGDATAEFLRGVLLEMGGIRVTRLALGLPVGADLDYADQVTVARAMRGRTEMSD